MEDGLGRSETGEECGSQGFPDIQNDKTQLYRGELLDVSRIHGKRTELPSTQSNNYSFKMNRVSVNVIKF